MSEEYIGSLYENLEENLIEFIKSENIDIITFRSLLRSSVEISEQDVSPATIGIISADASKGKRVHIRNYQFNLKHALDMIYATKTAVKSDGIMLVLAMIKVFLLLTDEFVLEFDSSDAVVLLCIHRLRGGSATRIYEYAKQLDNQIAAAEFSFEELEGILDKLEKIKMIQLIDGEYQLRDRIYITS